MPHRKPEPPRELVKEMKAHIKEKFPELVAEKEPEKKPEPVKLSPEERDLAKLLALHVEVRGGGVAQPFEGTLTTKGAQDILAALKEKS